MKTLIILALLIVIGCLFALTWPLFYKRGSEPLIALSGAVTGLLLSILLVVCRSLSLKRSLL